MSEIAFSTATAAPIGRDAVAAYGDAVGDHNPVHFDPEFAARAGLPDTVVHGPLTTAIVLDLLVAQLGADRILNLDLRLRGPVFPGDVLTVSPIDYGGGSHGVEVHNQGGGLVATAITILEGDPDA
jgi:acyl dehydratase